MARIAASNKDAKKTGKSAVSLKKTKTAGKSTKAKKPARGKSAKKKKRNVQLFVLDPEKQRREPLGTRVSPWPCASANPRRTSASGLDYAPPVELAWEAKLPGTPRTEPIVADDGSLYAADGEGNLLALDAATGRELWRFHTDPVSATSPARPLVESGVVPPDRVPLSAPPCVFEWRLFFGDDEGIFYGLRRGDGTVIFRKQAPLTLAARSQAAYAAPLAAGAIVYAADGDGTLHAASTEGTSLWSRVLRGRVHVAPALVARHVLVATHPLFPHEPSELHAIEAGSGERLWHRPLPGAPRSILGLEEGVLVLVEHELVRVSVETGDVIARRTFDEGERPRSALASDGSLVIVALPQGLLALDARSLETRWTARPKRGLEPIGAPAIARDHVWLAAREGLAVFEKATGQEVARAKTKGTPVTGVVLAAGKAFVGTDRPRVLAYAVSS
jgi:outer membrane protein assembly factor BamB